MHDGPATLIASRQAGAAMRTTILKYATGAGVSGMLAVGAAAGFGHVDTGTDPTRQVTQFCVPAHDDDPNAHRLYCRNEDGWSGPAGGAAFACFMQEIGQRTLPPSIDSLRPCRIAIAAANRTR
jgi:hypothetical protein